MTRAAFIFVLLAMLSLGDLSLGAQTEPSSSSSGGTYYAPSPQKSVEIGNFYLHRNDIPGALSRFQEAVRTDPDYAPAYLGLGKVYEKTSKPKLALSAYEKYLQELPSDRDAERAKGAQRAIKRLKHELASKKASRPAAKVASSR